MRRWPSSFTEVAFSFLRGSGGGSRSIVARAHGGGISLPAGPRSARQRGPCAQPDRQPEGRRDQCALSLSDSGGRLLVHCHKSGCAVLPELQRRGQAEGRGQAPAQIDPAEAERRKAEDRKREAQRLKTAHDLFAAAVNCEGTPAQSYLVVRGIVGLRFNTLRATLRFHPGARGVGGEGAGGQRA